MAGRQTMMARAGKPRGTTRSSYLRDLSFDARRPPAIAHDFGATQLEGKQDICGHAIDCDPRPSAGHSGENMRRVSFYLVQTGIFVGFATLALPSCLRAQGDVEKIYKTNCVLCHAADGSGNSTSGKALRAKDLASSEVQKQSDAELTEVIVKGKGKMPAFEKKLKPDDIKQLVAYVRALPTKRK